MIDAHCHLNLHSFEKDMEDVYNNAKKAGVSKIVNVGTSISSSKIAVELANKYSDMFAIVGVHPHHADKSDREFEGEIQNDWLSTLKVLASNRKVIGIGEIGLDYFHFNSNNTEVKRLQLDAFEKQIELSIELGLPVQIHNRLAGEDVIRILYKYKSRFSNPPGMFHCFAGTKDVLKKALDLGFYIGFDGNITYPGIAPKETVMLRDLATLTPIDRIMCETDSPFLTPIPLRGTRNEPKNVIIIGEYLAKLKKLSFLEFEKEIEKNFNRVFSKNV